MTFIRIYKIIEKKTCEDTGCNLYNKIFLLKIFIKYLLSKYRRRIQCEGHSYFFFLHSFIPFILTQFSPRA